LGRIEAERSKLTANVRVFGFSARHARTLRRGIRILRLSKLKQRNDEE
jgi:hypothetical protein